MVEIQVFGAYISACVAKQTSLWIRWAFRLFKVQETTTDSSYEGDIHLSAGDHQHLWLYW